jgi:hypothetical protein
MTLQTEIYFSAVMLTAALLILQICICVNQMMDPDGIANWSVTHVDWSEGKWHPKAYRAKDVTFELLKNISVMRLCAHLVFIFQVVCCP